MNKTEKNFAWLKDLKLTSNELRIFINEVKNTNKKAQENKTKDYKKIFNLLNTEITIPVTITMDHLISYARVYNNAEDYDQYYEEFYTACKDKDHTKAVNLIAHAFHPKIAISNFYWGVLLGQASMHLFELILEKSHYTRSKESNQMDKE